MKKESELKQRRPDSTSRENPKTQARASSGYPAPLTLRKTAEGLTVDRYFTRPGVDPFDAVEWEIRSAVISNEKGEIVFVGEPSQCASGVVLARYLGVSA